MGNFVVKIISYSFLFLGAFFLFLGLIPDKQLITVIKIINVNFIDQKGCFLLGLMFFIGAVVHKKLYLDSIE